MSNRSYLPQNASKARQREAENARKNRVEIVKAWSQGQVSRRELFKWGLFTTAGLLAPIHGLNLRLSDEDVNAVPNYLETSSSRERAGATKTTGTER